MMIINNVHYYPRIRDIREKEEKTQKIVATDLGMKQQQYSEYERGIREIPFYRAIEIANYLNVSLDYIAERTDNYQIRR